MISSIHIAKTERRLLRLGRKKEGTQAELGNDGGVIIPFSFAPESTILG